MKHLTIGHQSVSSIALGAMRIGAMEDSEIRALYVAAREAGINFFDHARIYGHPPHQAERRFGTALKLTSSERCEIHLQSKCGIHRPRPYYDSSYDHIMESAHASLRALSTDYLDILLLHRPDALVEPEEVARAFDQLYTDGKVLQFGVSNHTSMQMAILSRYLRQPIVVNQIQLSVAHAPSVLQGIAANMAGLAQSNDLSGAVFDYCRLVDVAIQAWSPLQIGWFEGSFIDSDRYPELNRFLGLLADKYSVSTAAVAIAWINRLPARMQVILGSTNPGRFRDAEAASEIVLTRQEWYEIARASGARIP